MVAMQLGRVVGAPLARGLIDAFGRNAYGSVQVAVTLMGFVGTYRMQQIVADRDLDAIAK